MVRCFGVAGSVGMFVHVRYGSAKRIVELFG